MAAVPCLVIHYTHSSSHPGTGPLPPLQPLPELRLMPVEEGELHLRQHQQLTPEYFPWPSCPLVISAHYRLLLTASIKTIESQTNRKKREENSAMFASSLIWSDSGEQGGRSVRGGACLALEAASRRLERRCQGQSNGLQGDPHVPVFQRLSPHCGTSNCIAGGHGVGAAMRREGGVTHPIIDSQL